MGLWAAGVVIVLLLTDNAWWLQRYRVEGMFDIDEAGYLGTALEHSVALQQAGLAGSWHVYQAHAPSAPLVPLAAGVVYALVGARLMAGFVVLMAALVVVLITSQSLAARLSSPPARIPTLIAVAGIPGLFDYARTFQFAMPVAACITGALVCLAASRQLLRLGPTLGWGVLIGLMLLSRTMTVAFLPGLLGAGLLVAALSPNRPRALLNLLAGTLAAGLVAGTWYLTNAPVVAAYLFNFGYGQQSQQYGGGSPRSAWLIWAALRRDLDEYVYLPLALLLVAGAAAAAGVALRVLRSRPAPAPGRLVRIFANPYAPTAIAILLCLSALLSTANQGTGFIVPLLPAATVLAVAALARLHAPPVRVAGLALAVVVGIAGLIGKSGLSPFDGAPLLLTVPGQRQGLAVLRPAGPIQLYEFDGGYGDGTLQPPPGYGDWGRAAIQAADTATTLSLDNGQRPVCAFGFRDRFFNPNTVNVQLAAQLRDPLSSFWLEPGIGSTADDFTIWLTVGPAASATVLISASPSPSEIAPAVDQRAMETAAQASSFTRANAVVLPNGRRLTFWVRPSHPAGVEDGGGRG